MNQLFRYTLSGFLPPNDHLIIKVVAICEQVARAKVIESIYQGNSLELSCYGWGIDLREKFKDLSVLEQWVNSAKCESVPYDPMAVQIFTFLQD
jgi:hypothetical protein